MMKECKKEQLFLFCRGFVNSYIVNVALIVLICADRFLTLLFICDEIVVSDSRK